jgi:hypothetical protein
MLIDLNIFHAKTLINFNDVGKPTEITLKETANMFVTPFTRTDVMSEKRQLEDFPLWDAATASANSCVGPNRGATSSGITK